MDFNFQKKPELLILFSLFVLFSSCKQKSVTHAEIYADPYHAQYVNDLLRVYHELYPNFPVQLKTTGESIIRKKLLEGDIQLAILSEPYSKSEQKKLSLHKLEISQHRMAKGAILLKDSLGKGWKTIPAKLNINFQSIKNEWLRTFLLKKFREMGIRDSGKSSLTNLIIKKLNLQNIGNEEFWAIPNNEEKRVYPSISNIIEEKYPLTYNLYVVNRYQKKDAFKHLEAFILCDKGQRILLRSGLIPAKDPGRQLIVKPNF